MQRTYYRRGRQTRIPTLRSLIMLEPGRIRIDILARLLHLLRGMRPIMALMYGPAARRKRFSSICRMWVLHQCIRPHIGACHAPGHHGYQRACDLINVQASTGPTGPPVFARTGKTDLPSRLILSQTSSAGKSYRSDYVIAGSSFCAAAVIGGGE